MTMPKLEHGVMPSFPRKRESMLLWRRIKMDSCFRGNDGLWMKLSNDAI